MDSPDWPWFVRCVVLDILFVALTILFFVVSLGYIAVCDRLMK